MGRGRAKAKQTKVARRLKYYSPDTDLTALERELKGTDGDTLTSRPTHAPEDDEYTAETRRGGYSRANGRDGETARTGDEVNGARDRAATAKPSVPPTITPGSWMKKQS